MRKTLFTIALPVVCSFLASLLPFDLQAQTPLPRHETLDVVTWNIEWFGTPGRTPRGKSFEYQLEEASKALLALDADVYALQEITASAQVEFLHKLVEVMNLKTAPGTFAGLVGEHYAYFWKGYDNNFPPMKPSFIYRKATVTPKSVRGIFSGRFQGPSGVWPNGYPGGKNIDFWANGRLPLELVADVQIGGKKQEITFVNIHAKSGVDSRDRRMFDAQALLDTLSTPTYEERKLVLLGSFADYLRGSVNSGLASAYAPFLEGQQRKFQQGSTEAQMTDHLLFSEELFLDYLEAPKNVYYGQSPISDHLPICVSFKLQEELCINPAQAGQTQSSDVRLMPNTQQRNFSLDWDLEEGNTAQLQVFDVSGQLKMRMQVMNGEHISTAGWEKGAYELQLSRFRKKDTLRIFVN